MTDTSLPTERPLGFWLRSLDALITREFARVLHADGIDRRDWMILDALDGTIDAPPLVERLQRGGKRVRALAERGWVAHTDERWTLTDEGRAAKARLSDAVDGIRATVAGAVSPDDYATTLASLEAMARALGADDLGQMPFGDGAGFGPRGHRHGFGPGRFGPHRFGRGAGRGHVPDDGADRPHDRSFGFGPGFGPHGFGPGFRPGVGPGLRPGDDHRGERAYERGFDAGFARGRESRTA
jgi:hypothetical protein